jgi:uncharacterized membrane-anchored protein
VSAAGNVLIGIVLGLVIGGAALLLATRDTRDTAHAHTKETDMLLTLSLILQIVAFIAFVAAAAGVPARINLVATGLALWVLSIIVA